MKLKAFDDITKAHAAAKSLGLPVTEIVNSPVNHYGSFLIAPDGSKEGWPEADEYFGLREKWIRVAQFASENNDWYADSVAVEYGGDRDRPRIVGEDSSR